MLIFKYETPSLEAIRNFFHRTDDEFEEPLSQRINIEEYTLKLYTYADFFVCYSNNEIAGMICCYINNPPLAYIPYVCVHSQHQRKGIFSRLFEMLEKECISQNMSQIKLEVKLNNTKAIKSYKKMEFEIIDTTPSSYFMLKQL